MYDNMKQVVIKRLLKREDSTLNRQFEDFAGFYGFKSILCRPYRGQTKGKVERTVQFVRDNFMVGIKYNSLADLNGQALAWCNKVNGKVHATTNEIPFERLKKEGLSSLTCEYIIDKINLRRVQKDCLILYASRSRKTESLHRHQYQRRVLPPEGTQGIYAPETAGCEHSFRARQQLILLLPSRKTTKFLRRFLTISNRR